MAEAEAEEGSTIEVEAEVDLRAAGRQANLKMRNHGGSKKGATNQGELKKIKKLRTGTPTDTDEEMINASYVAKEAT